VKTRDIRRALTTKGFRETRSGDHCYFYFYAGERKTSVYTKFSHNSTDVDDALLSQMSKQVRLRRHEFDHLVDCRLTARRYLAILVGKQQVTIS
jgi:hypothetical protein